MLISPKSGIKELNDALAESLKISLTDLTSGKTVTPKRSNYNRSTIFYDTPLNIAPKLPKLETGEVLGEYKRKTSLDYETSGIMPAHKEGYWVDPSDEAFYAGLSGGGSYVNDPNQIGKLIKSENIIDNSIKKTIRGGRSPKLYEVDHIVPLWAGGDNELANLQVLPIDQHDNKTITQAVAATLYFNKKISLGDARVMAISWKDKNVKDLALDDNGNLIGGVETAQKKAAEWAKGPSYTDYLIDSIKESPGNLISTIRSLGKKTEKFIEEKAVNKYIPDLTWEAIESGLNAFTAPLTILGLNTSFDTEDDSAYSNRQTPIESLMLMGMGMSREEATKPRPRTETEKTISKVGQFTTGVAGSLASFGALGKVMSIAGSGLVSKYPVIGKVFTGSKISSLKSPLTSKFLTKNTKLLKAIGFFNIYGQLSMPLSADAEQRARSVVNDSLTATVLTKFSPNLKGLVGVGSSVFALGIIDDEKPGDAALNAITMMVLHGMGGRARLKGEKTKAFSIKGPALNPKLKGEAQITEAKNIELSKLMGEKEFNEWRFEKFNGIRTNKYLKENERIIKKMEDATPKNIAAEDKLIGEKIKKSLTEGKISNKSANKSVRNLAITSRELYKSGSPKEVRVLEDMKEWSKVMNDLENITVGYNSGVPEVLSNHLMRGEQKIDPSKYKTPKDAPNPGKLFLTGTSTELIDAATGKKLEVGKNVRTFADNVAKGKADPKVYLIINKGEAQNYVEINKKKSDPTADKSPEKAIEAWADINGKGKWEKVGYVPSSKTVTRQNEKLKSLKMPKVEEGLNKDGLHDFMIKNNLFVIETRIARDFLNPSEYAVKKAGVISKQPYIVTDVTINNIMESIAKNKGAKSTGAIIDERKTKIVNKAIEELEINASDYWAKMDTEFGQIKVLMSEYFKVIEKNLVKGTPEKLAKDVNKFIKEDVLTVEEATKMMRNADKLTIRDGMAIIAKADPNTNMIHKSMTEWGQDPNHSKYNKDGVLGRIKILGKDIRATTKTAFDIQQTVAGAEPARGTAVIEAEPVTAPKVQAPATATPRSEALQNIKKMAEETISAPEIVKTTPKTKVVHEMPDGKIMAGKEHKGAIEGSERVIEAVSKPVPASQETVVAPKAPKVVQSINKGPKMERKTPSDAKKTKEDVTDKVVNSLFNDIADQMENVKQPKTDRGRQSYKRNLVSRLNSFVYSAEINKALKDYGLSGSQIAGAKKQIIGRGKAKAEEIIRNFGGITEEAEFRHITKEQVEAEITKGMDAGEKPNTLINNIKTAKGWVQEIKSGKSENQLYKDIKKSIETSKSKEAKLYWDSYLKSIERGQQGRFGNPKWKEEMLSQQTFDKLLGKAEEVMTIDPRVLDYQTAVMGFKFETLPKPLKKMIEEQVAKKEKRTGKKVTNIYAAPNYYKQPIAAEKFNVSNIIRSYVKTSDVLKAFDYADVKLDRKNIPEDIKIFTGLKGDQPGQMKALTPENQEILENYRKDSSSANFASKETGAKGKIQEEEGISAQEFFGSSGQGFSVTKFGEEIETNLFSQMMEPMVRYKLTDAEIAKLADNNAAATISAMSGHYINEKYAGRQLKKNIDLLNDLYKQDPKAIVTEQGKEFGDEPVKKTIEQLLGEWKKLTKK